MKEIKITGGARIGMANATFPFASLAVTQHKLTLNATVLGKLVFQPSDIISIEIHSQMPIIGQGIKIIHRVANYKEKVIFWTFKNPQTLINQIKETGFWAKINTDTNANDLEVIEKQKQSGFPIKKPAAIGAIVLWNLLFVADFMGFTGTFGIGILSALGFVFLSALLTLVSSGFRGLVLKEGRDLDSVKVFLYFMMFITGVMFAAFGSSMNLFGS